MATYDVPRLPNHLAVSDYFRSRDFTRRYRSGRTVPGRSASMTRFETSERLRETEEALVSTKRFQRAERSILDERWDRLAEAQSGFRHDFIEFDKFVEENADKRRRAAVKIREKDDLSTVYDQSIRNLRRDYGDLEGLIAAMDASIERHRLYEDFLSEVVRRNPKQFSTVDDVVGRFVTLLRTRDELQRSQVEGFRRLEELRRTTAAMIDRHRCELIGLGTRLAELRTRRELCSASCLEREAAVDSILVEAIAKTREAVEVRDAALRIYRETRSRRGDVEPPDSAARLLEHVKRTLARYRRVNEAIAEAGGEEARLSEAALPSDR